MISMFVNLPEKKSKGLGHNIVIQQNHSANHQIYTAFDASEARYTVEYYRQ